MNTPKSEMTVAGLMIAWSCLGWSALANGQALAPAAQPRQEAAPAATTAVAPADRPEDRAAIYAMAEAFTRAYNAGDAKSLAALFTDDAEVIDEEGIRIHGGPEIETAYAGIFQARPGAAIEISRASLRFLGPDVATEEGHTRIKPRGGSPESLRRYTLLYVRQGNRWLYSMVREEHPQVLTPHEHLKELEWLIGEWVDEGSEATVHATCRWTPDKNFLLRDFLVHAHGRPVMTVNQRIGWDPLTKQIKSWFFDSEGGYGSALWVRHGDQWIIKSTGVLPDGKTATATNVLTKLSPTQARWLSSERTVGGESIPEQLETFMVRRAPAPGAR
jgi:uncharacterized protein (TIGR02246 family)